MSGVKQVIAINENEAERTDSRQSGPVPKVVSSDSELVRAVRRRLPNERRAITHHFSIAGQEGYVTVGVYEDGLPGEIFVRMAKEGSTVSGLMDAFATVVSLALQHGVPL
jgi:ribonucleoside-diphosphate reductase alpha chain